MDNGILEIKNLKKYFNVKKGLLHAVDNVSFYIDKGETLGLVGESGCGKSTIGRLILRLIESTSGEIYFKGINLLELSKKDLKNARKEIQIVFQDPYSSLDGRKSVFESISEPFIVQNVYREKKDMTNHIYDLMGKVGLSNRMVNAYPHELDGGRRQRVGIARALALNPSFIVLDEPVSALDVSIQAQVINLLKDLQNEMNLTYLFISHDLSVVKHISNRVAVMYLGKIVEIASSNEIFKNPLHPYTKALLSAVPIPKLNINRKRIILKGDVPSPINPKPGCRFAGRCFLADDACREKDPSLLEYSNNHFVSCFKV